MLQPDEAHIFNFLFNIVTMGFFNRMHINDLCDPELVSSVVRQYIPDAVLKGQKRDELCFRLPLENTNSFPGKKPVPVPGF